MEMTQFYFLSSIQFIKEDRHENQTKSEAAANVGYTVCTHVCFYKKLSLNTVWQEGLSI